jgi:multidrug efflux pump subunit AcrA (membrane-fusion protein)
MMRRKTSIILAVILGVLAGSISMYLISGTPYLGKKAVPDEQLQPEAAKKVLYWRAPMDPTYISDKPGKSPMGMDLIPVYEGEEEEVEPGTVKIDPVTVQNIGVRTAKIEKRPLIKTLRTIGRVDYDEKKVYRVHTKIDGWIEKLYVDFTGKEVKKDDILLEIYSPTLVSAQEEYLLALEYRETMAGVGRESIPDLSRRRLELWDVPEHQIKELEETGRIMKTLHIHSPAGGIVTEKPVVEGMFVKPGTTLYTIADISTVWVYADVYEYELPWVKAGQGAEVTLEAYPGRVFKGRVSFIYPFMEPRTRTNKVRLVFDNPGFKLKPDMYANVTLESMISKDAVAVPAEAVIRTGERNIVILTKGEGKFTPRGITLGPEAEQYFQVLEGLKEGDEVVTSAQFLIDSESKLKEAITKMLEGEKTGPSDMEEMEDDSLEHKNMEKGQMDEPGMEIRGEHETTEDMQSGHKH